MSKGAWRRLCCGHAADLSSDSRQGFGRGNTKSNQNLKASYNNAAQPQPGQQQPPMPPLVNSPSMSSTYSQEVPYNESEPKKFLNEKHAKCSVKGNFLTLAAQPKNVDLGEWLAHQREFDVLRSRKIADRGKSWK